MNTNGLLCSKWNTFLLTGLLFIVLGTLAISSAFISTMAAVIVFGIILTASGIFHMVNAFWSPEWRGFFGEITMGILSSVVGWLLIVNPMLGAISLTLLLAAFFMAGGLFKIAGALVQHMDNWGWLLLSGIISLLLGIIIYAQWPAASLWLIGLFIGIDLLFSGWSHVMFALHLRKECQVPRQTTVS